MVDRYPGCTLCLTLQGSSTVRNVKQEIEGRIGIPCTVQRLRHQGRPVIFFYIFFLFSKETLQGDPLVFRRIHGIYSVIIICNTIDIDQ